MGDAGSGFAGSGSGLAIVSSSWTSDPPLSYVKLIRIESWEISIRRCVPAITSLNSHGPARRVVRTVGEAGFDPSRRGLPPESSMTVSWSAAVVIAEALPSHQFNASSARGSRTSSAATGRRSIRIASADQLMPWAPDLRCHNSMPSSVKQLRLVKLCAGGAIGFAPRRFPHRAAFTEMGLPLAGVAGLVVVFEFGIAPKVADPSVVR